MVNIIRYSLSLLFVGLLSCSSVVFSDDVKHGDKVKIITPDVNARLCPSPNCGSNQHITRIPNGTVMEIEGIQNVKAGMFAVKWFEVTFKGKRGWVSIYDTDKQ